MRVFRQKYTGRDGTVKNSAKWYVEFRDHREVARRVPGYSDKGASRELGRKLERLASLRGAGDVPDSELLRWLESIPQELRDRLVKFDLIDGRSNVTGKLLVDHLADFRANMEHRSRTAAHTSLVVKRIESILTDCKFRVISDISASRVQACLSEIRQRGLSPQTANHYLRAIKQFTRWLMTDRRATENPLLHLETVQAAGDVRCVRRELSSDELAQLLTATRNGPSRFGLTGWERFTLYAAAVGTGFRASELASLTPRSFDFTSEPPTVTINAMNAKSRKSDTLPMPADLAELLEPWVRTLADDARLWPGRWAEYKQGSKFMQLDLAAARTAWIAAAETTQEQQLREKSDFLLYADADGSQADFHSLRHTYLSRLGRAGVPAKVMQRLARHSTVELTIGRYTHANVYDLAAGVAALPPLPTGEKPDQQEQQVLRASGTDDYVPTGKNVLPFCLPETVAKPRNRVHRDAVTTNEAGEDDEKSDGLSAASQLVKLRQVPAKTLATALDPRSLNPHPGEVAEWSIAPVLKTGDGVTRPRVRIPASPLRFPARTPIF